MKKIETPVKKSLRLLFAPGAILLMLLSSCIKDNNNYVRPPVAYLSFVQASTDEPPLNLYLNSNLVNNLAPIQYGNSFGYINAYPGLRTANINNAFTGGQLLSDTMTLRQNTYYTLFLANTAAHPQTLLLTDTLTRPAQGDATVRFVNLSPDAGAVDLQLKSTGTTTIANKSFFGHSGFVTLAAGSGYNLTVTATGTSTALASQSTVNLVGGGVYTIWLYGLKNSTTSADNLAIGSMVNAFY